MKKIDGRKLKHNVLEAIRIRAVQQVESGESPEIVIKALGMTRGCIYKWIAKYREGGAETLKACRLNGRPLTLKGEQLRWIFKTITSKNPLQLKFPYALWTREMVKELIKEKYGIILSVISVGRLLKKLGLSCQKPLMRAFQQDAVVVKEWVEKTYPKINKLALKEGAEIYFEDEAGVRSDYHLGTTWAVKGETPIVRTTGARFGLNMISAITARGSMRFMTHRGKVNAVVFCGFLKRLLFNVKNKIFLIVDGHPVHRSTRVKRLVESMKGKLRLFYLPPYSPELNPDELVWNNVKGKIGRSTIEGPDDLETKVRGHLRNLQKNPDKISGFFRNRMSVMQHSYVFLLMNSLVLSMVLLGCISVNAYCSSQWDDFLLHPDKDTLLALENNITASANRCSSDVTPTQKQRTTLFELIRGGNQFAFHAALFVYRCWDGGELEDFYRGAGTFFELQPDIFLFIVKEEAIPDLQLRYLLIMLPLYTIDNIDHKISVVEHRIKILKRLSDGAFSEIKRKGLFFLEKEKENLSRIRGRREN